MDYGLNEGQEMLRKTSRDFLAAECPKNLVRQMVMDKKGYSPELWHKIAELGWLGLAFPEKYGGTGGNFIDLVVLLEEMGRACLPSPFFSTVVLGGMTILAAGDEQQKQELLHKIAEGTLLLTLAINEPNGGYDLGKISAKAIIDEDHFILNGTKLFVHDAHIVDHIICFCKIKGETALFLVNAQSHGIAITLLETIAGDKQCEVVFDQVAVPKKDIVGDFENGQIHLQRVLEKAAVAKCAEMVGGAQQVLEMTVSYVKERKQFDVPVGSFQAIQHHCANMMTYIDTSRFLTYKAAWMLSEGLACGKEIAMAKAWLSDAYRRVTLLGHQCIGGVAFMEDHDLPLYSKRAKAAEIAFGDADFHCEVVAQELGL